MAERNAIKNRACKFCGECMLGKASKLKEHARECKQVHENAAARALMEKMQADMQEFAEPFVKMADERVMNAEGD